MFVGLALGEFGAVESLGLEQDRGDQVAYPEELAVGLHALDRESLEPGLFLGSRGAEENAVEQPLDGVIHLFFGWRGVSRVNQVEELSGVEFPLEVLPLMRRTSVSCLAAVAVLAIS